MNFIFLLRLGDYCTELDNTPCRPANIEEG